MAMIRWFGGNSIIDDLRKMQREMDDLWRSVGEGTSKTGVKNFTSGSVAPPINVMKNDAGFTILCELPGCDVSDIDISISGDTLVLKGERHIPELEGVSYHRRERYVGGFNRSITLPDMLDNERTEATFKNGILRVDLYKAQQAEPKQIKVQIG